METPRIQVLGVGALRTSSARKRATKVVRPALKTPNYSRLFEVMLSFKNVFLNYCG